ncbi:MAG TPA: hypothetical protein VI296_08010 [Candidatus Dormibacteraeota bacterium]
MGEMKEGGKPEKQRPPRWDSFPLGHVTPRWDAGVRYWPGGIPLLSVFVLFIVLNTALGFTNGPLVAASAVASYPLLLILVPIRKRLVPREVGASASPVPLRLWVLGWLLVAVGVVCYPFGLNAYLATESQLLSFLGEVLVFGLIYSGTMCVTRALAWEQWRHRPPKKGRKSPQNGDGAPNGAATVGQPH